MNLAQTHDSLKNILIQLTSVYRNVNLQKYNLKSMLLHIITRSCQTFQFYESFLVFMVDVDVWVQRPQLFFRQSLASMYHCILNIAKHWNIT